MIRMNTTSQSRDIRALFDATPVDSHGLPVGCVREIYVDNASGRPTFAEIAYGPFHAMTSIVPLAGASFEGGRLTLAFSRATMRTAPGCRSGYLSYHQQGALLKHYGVNRGPTPGHYATNPGTQRAAS